MRAINPATEEPLADYREHTPDDVESLLRQADAAFADWRRVPLADRGRLMRQAAVVLRGRAEELAHLMAAEMGKPITGGEAEIEKCAAACDYYADHAAEFLTSHEVATDATRSYVRHDPLGPIFAVMPWNFPFWQVFRFAAPALMAGNVGVLKHAPNVPGCAVAIEQIFRDAGFPPGVFTSLLVGVEQTPAVSDAVIRHPAIRAVTLTGSDRAGRAVAAAAGSALKKVVLELGGSDPFIVLADATRLSSPKSDVQVTANAAAAARCINGGQSCIAAKRFIVEHPIAADFERAFAAALAATKVGDPLDRSTQIGPLTRRDLRDSLARQVGESVAAGARLVTGGTVPAGRGFYYPATLLADVRPGMAAFDEETFGPVAALVVARDEADAVRLANATPFGLGASIWTRDTARAERLAAEIDAGCVFVNGPVKSDPRLPFGGIKGSGYGRELAAEGIREFVNVKTVWVKDAPQSRAVNRGE